MLVITMRPIQEPAVLHKDPLKVPHHLGPLLGNHPRVDRVPPKAAIIVPLLLDRQPIAHIARTLASIDVECNGFSVRIDWTRQEAVQSTVELWVSKEDVGEKPGRKVWLVGLRQEVVSRGVLDLEQLGIGRQAPVLRRGPVFSDDASIAT